MAACMCNAPWRPEEGVRSPGIGVAGGCEPPIWALDPIPVKGNDNHFEIPGSGFLRPRSKPNGAKLKDKDQV